MNTYTVEIRTGILTGNHDLHSWIIINKPDGTSEGWGFYPENENVSNTIYGPGDVKPENPTDRFTSTSGPIVITESQYNLLESKILAADANPPNYSVLSLPGGIQCSMWAVELLQDIGVIPVVLSPEITPALIPFLDSLLWNPIVQTIGFDLSGWINSLKQTARVNLPDLAANNINQPNDATSDFVLAALLGGHLSGGAGDDFLLGNIGDDVLDGGLGNDLLIYQQGTTNTLVGRISYLRNPPNKKISINDEVFNFSTLLIQEAA